MKFGLIIVVAALMGSIIAGSIAMETGTHDKTAYNHLTDLAPITTYEDVDQSIQYNPVKNVTGWTGVTYQYQSNPTIYAMQLPQTSSTVTSSTLGAMGGVYYGDGAAYGYDGGFSYGGEYPYIVWSDMESGTNPTEEQWPLMGWNPRYDANGKPLMIGGYTQSWEQTGWRVESNVHVGLKIGDNMEYGTSSTNPYYWQLLNRVAAAQGWDTGTVVSTFAGPNHTGVTVYGSMSFEGYYLQRIVTGGNNWGSEEVTWTTAGNLILNIGGFVANQQYWWDRNTATFHLITGTDATGLPQFSAKSTELVWISHSLDDTLELTKWVSANTAYVRPYSDVTVAGDAASWSNGYNNDRLQLLISPDVDLVLNSTGYRFSLPSEASSYNMIMVTLDKQMDQSYWQGVMSYQDPSAYSLIEYRRPLFDTTAARELTTGDFIGSAMYAYVRGTHVQVTIPADLFPNQQLSVTGTNATLTGNVVDISDLQTNVTIHLSWSAGQLSYSLTANIVPMPNSPISSIIVIPHDTDETTRAYVANTWIPADPNGLLWQNPSMDLYGYFPDLIETSGIRVAFGAVLSTGTSLNLFGRSFDTGDGKILIDGGLYPINGLSVDLDPNGDVEIFSGDYEIVSYAATVGTVSGSGVWLWSAALYEQVTTVVEDVSVHFGEGPSKDWAIFAFIGLCVAGIVAFAAWGRGSMDIWDWAVLGVAVLMGFMVI